MGAHAARSYCRVSTPAPCSHEPANSRILHVSYAAQHGHHHILIRTVDTDVVVLAVFSINHLPAECELWLTFGTGKTFRYLAAHQIAASLGPEMLCALPMFHALTGCYIVSSFAGHGQKTAWSTWKSLPELTDALLMLADGPKVIPDDAMNRIERFVILLFDRTRSCTKVDHATSSFHEQNSVKQIPPTRAALEEHVKRAVYQGGHIWGRHCYRTLCCHHQLIGGWVKTEGKYMSPIGIHCHNHQNHDTS